MKPPYPLCAICRRFPRGFGFSPPGVRLDTPAGRNAWKVFHSMQCMNLYTETLKKHGDMKMIDPNTHEVAAMEAAKEPFYQLLDEIGWERRIKELQPHEVTSIIEVIVTAYHHTLIERANKRWPEGGKA